MLSFTLNINPPTTTAQEHKVGIRNGKPYFYDPPELKDTKQKLMAYLGQHKPKDPFTGPLCLCAIWMYPASGKHKPGTWRDTKPDTDNLQKLLKDCMTMVGFWKDDAQVVQEIIEKRWVRSEERGIFVEIYPAEELNDDNLFT